MNKGNAASVHVADAPQVLVAKSRPMLLLPFNVRAMKATRNRVPATQIPLNNAPNSTAHKIITRFVISTAG